MNTDRLLLDTVNWVAALGHPKGNLFQYFSVNNLSLRGGMPKLIF